MSWTDTEWEAFAGLLEEGWPGEFADSTSDAWRVLLDGTDPPAAVGALRRLLLEGRRFRPSVSELLAELRRDPSKPTFDEALLLIRRALVVNVNGVFPDQAEMRAAEHKAVLERLGDPLVRSFVERQGIDRVRSLQLDDPTWGEKTRRELEGAWDRHCEATDGREIAALASGSGEPRQLDPLASLQLVKGDGAA